MNFHKIFDVARRIACCAIGLSIATSTFAHITDQMVADHIVGTAPLNAEHLGQADVNGDDEVDIADVVMLVNRQPWSMKLTPLDGTAGDRFGISVSISGDTAIIGAYNQNNRAGAAYIFRRHGPIWTQEAKLTAMDPQRYDWFGNSVSISGDTAIIGADQDDWGRGAVYILNRTGSTWTQEAKLTASDAAAGDQFGESVSISGDSLMVGVAYEASSLGAAYIFERDESIWTQQAKLAALDFGLNAYLGSSVSHFGDTVIFGSANGGPDLVPPSIFTRRGSTWTEQEKLTASEGEAGDNLGRSISLFQDMVIVSARSGDEGDEDSAYIFTRTDSIWTQQNKIAASDGEEGDRFGVSVALSEGTAIVGALSS